jgi:hypothetical protein
MTLTDSSEAGIIQSHQNDVPSKVKLMLHHQFPGVELVSPAYAGGNATCYLLPHQKVDVGSTTRIGFVTYRSCRTAIGVLVYKLQRKDFDQSNEETISNEGKTTCTYLVMKWQADSSEGFFAGSRLTEYDEGCVWSRDKLLTQAGWCDLYNIQHGHIKGTWLMCNNTVLMTEMYLTLERKCYKIEMTIYEGSIKDDTWRPWHIDIVR